MKRYYILFVMSVLALAALSCSGSSSGPVTPDSDLDLNLTSEREVQNNQSSAHLWGLWEIYLGQDNKSIEVVPLRGAAFTCNVVRFIDGPPSFLILDIESVDPQPGYLDIVLDVGLQHPFPGLDRYTGFDVLGVFMGEGTSVFPGSDAFPIAGANDQQLLNPDGFTRWFNAPEFSGAGTIMPLFGYFPGKHGTPDYVPSAVLNSYKYFADGLEKYNNAFDFLVDNSGDRGCFKPGSVNRRSYELRFPDTAGIRFQYAVIAHWEPNESFPEPPENLDDFPLTANADESVVVDIVDHSNVYYVGGSSGGKVILDISPWDWSAECNVSGAMEEYAIRCYSRAWSGAYNVDMTPTVQADHYCTFHAEIPVRFIFSNDPFTVWIEVNYPNLDYTNYLGIGNDAEGSLSGYCRIDVPVADEIPPWIEILCPNGGEEWTVGSSRLITWISQNVTGTVAIEYSKDNFIADINTIMADEDNLGYFIWDPIPDDPSDTVRVRISSTVDPGIYDTSDDDFSIVESLITVLRPNGGEKWGVGSAEEITWESQYVDGTLFIEYSKDNFVADINTIATDEDNDGSFMWDPIPDDPSDTVRVRVSSTDDTGVFDDSDADFSITDTYITVVIPNGGEEWGIGAAEEIVWASHGVPGTVFIEYSKDNFVTDINMIATDETNDGSFMWAPIPDDPSETVRVRVSSTDDPGIYDVSDADFTIVEPSITVLVPNGGEIWGSGSAQEILWSSHGVTGPVLIEYSKDMFVSDVNVIASGEPSDGSFIWHPVPPDYSDTVRVRISWIDYPFVNDISDDDFSIVYREAGWARTWGGGQGDYGYGVATDGSGNICVTGYFSTTADFDPDGGDQHTSNGEDDVFLSKFDSSGDFLWARTWGGSGQDLGYGVAIDDFGNIYVTGEFIGSVDFNPGGGDLHDSNGAEDVFLSKFDSSGNFLWARTWGGSDFESGWGVCADSFGNIYVVGHFNGTADFDPDSGDPHTSNGLHDVFLSRFDLAGNFQWARTWGGTESDYALGVANDSSGNIYVTGEFLDTVDFNPDGGDPHSSNGDADVFLSKFGPSGSLEWAQIWGGSYMDRGNGVAVDGFGNAYVTGEFADTVFFDPDDGEPRASKGVGDAFLSKFDPSGNFDWVRTWGAGEWDEGTGVVVDDDGNVYVTGNFYETVDFNPWGGEVHTSNGLWDIFLSRFDSSGNFYWARTWGAESEDTAAEIAVEGSSSIYITGRFENAIDFAITDPPCYDDSDVHESNGFIDAFLTKHAPDGCW